MDEQTLTAPMTQTEKTAYNAGITDALDKLDALIAGCKLTGNYYGRAALVKARLDVEALRK